MEHIKQVHVADEVGLSDTLVNFTSFFLLVFFFIVSIYYNPKIIKQLMTANQEKQLTCKITEDTSRSNNSIKMGIIMSDCIYYLGISNKPDYYNFSGESLRKNQLALNLFSLTPHHKSSGEVRNFPKGIKYERSEKNS